ncbi:MAG: DUF1460 domain-containing protein [Prevotella sp.]|nr:DUF1460 domain-containing protein [Prevotella sp.]
MYELNFNSPPHKGRSRDGVSCLFLLLLFLITFATPARSQNDSLFVEKVLNEAPADADVLYFARQFLGLQYVAHTLEVNDKEQLVVNTRQLDCTTLVENAAALALCHKNQADNYASFCHYLCQLRYRQGKLDGYTSRLHYFSDWIADNVQMGYVEEKQTDDAPYTAVQTLKLDYMSKHPQQYKALKANPELVKTIARQEKNLTGRKYRYIPKQQIGNTATLRKAVADGDIIAITCSKPGLDIAHLGFAVWHKDGLHLLNASQLHKKVVEEPMTLEQYLSRHPSFTGIRVVQLL